MDITYIRETVKETVNDIVKNDLEENKRSNLEGMNITIINMCDCFKLLSRAEAEEIRRPIIEELRKLKD